MGRPGSGGALETSNTGRLGRGPEGFRTGGGGALEALSNFEDTTPAGDEREKKKKKVYCRSQQQSRRISSIRWIILSKPRSIGDGLLSAGNVYILFLRRHEVMGFSSVGA